MTSIVEAVTTVVNSLIDEEPKPPLHVGEVMNCWILLAIFQEAHTMYISGLNTTTDSELRHALEKAEIGSRQDTDRLKKFMTEEGVPLPPAPEDKPKSNPDAVPLGVKLTNDELANAVSAKIASVITICGSAMAQSVRNDIGILFFQFQVHLMKYGAVFKSLMRERGWLKVPPYYYPPGRPRENE
ncbi:DUF3231 family protein [Aneurinibacillus tyrosinisolvens]|uniref:DUF3231 family protein n=1 Tax=Aneurinibacillus tyrosinisolvens TaxID=1443435 RepID=UPI00063F619A|nr:DUF3231 family protein [Aneurinibacillus tyrosinisolvens]